MTEPTDKPNEYARRVVALRLLSAIGHTPEVVRFETVLDEVMSDLNIRDAVAYLAGLAFESYRARFGDWAKATAEIDAQLKMAEDIESLGRTAPPAPNETMAMDWPWRCNSCHRGSDHLNDKGICPDCASAGGQ
ncbi:MAG: hypothetical protein HYZ39_22315 [Mycolicibacterium cosmeticum]|nr:hypothetical protein [Mycolicibacterium cosmeticum]